MLKDVDLFVWDFDGVIAKNYDEDGHFCWPALEERLDMDFEKFQHKIFIEIGFHEFAKGNRDLIEEADKILPACGYHEGGETFVQLWFDHDHQPIEGALDLVREVRSLGIPCVLGTNNERHRLKRILGDWGYDGHFDKVYAAGHMGTAKPEADFYHHITQDQGIADPSRVLFVDDYPEFVEGARAYGWQVIQHGHAPSLTLGCHKELRRKLGL